MGTELTPERVGVRRAGQAKPSPQMSIFDSLQHNPRTPGGGTPQDPREQKGLAVLREGASRWVPGVQKHKKEVRTRRVSVQGRQAEPRGLGPMDRAIRPWGTLCEEKRLG